MAGRKHRTRFMRSLMLECVDSTHGQPTFRKRARCFSWRDSGGVARSCKRISVGVNGVSMYIDTPLTPTLLVPLGLRFRLSGWTRGKQGRPQGVRQFPGSALPAKNNFGPLEGISVPEDCPRSG